MPPRRRKTGCLTHTWYFRTKNGNVVSAIAFFDTREFDEFWNRVSPSK